MNSHAASIVRLPTQSVQSDQAGADIAVVPKFKFVKARDGRGREVDGLWIRNARFYYQMSVPDKDDPGRKHCRRIPLLNEQKERVTSVQQAKEAIDELRRKKRDGDMPQSGRAPHFNEYVKHYLAWMEDTQAKKPKTLAQEKSALKGWAEHLGSIRLNQITKKHVNDYILKRKQADGNRRQRGGNVPLRTGVGNRTANMDVIVLRNCLKFAQSENHISGKLPTDGWKPLQYRAPKRPLWTHEQIEHLCEVALSKAADGSPRFKNGELLADAVRFMRGCGARVTSALATLWSDVDWSKRQLHLRKTKYGKQNIVVDFNDELEAHLKSMYARRLPDRDNLFPGTRSEGSVGSLRKTFEEVRKEAGLHKFRFHDLRHFFISSCIACGATFLTVAKWVGHEDGGVLICKVYGHLSDEHAKFDAKKVSFGSADKRTQSVPENGNLSDAELLRLLQQRMNKA